MVGTSELGAKREEPAKIKRGWRRFGVISQGSRTFRIGKLRLKGTTGDSALPTLLRLWALASKAAFVHQEEEGRGYLRFTVDRSRF